MRFFYLKVILFLVSFILAFNCFAENTIKTPMPISGRNPSSTQQIRPADVLARVRLIQSEINLIRHAMGKPRLSQDLISVKGASPREVYFEAQALFQKSNRLAYEVTGSFEPESKIHSGSLLPIHVWLLANAALKRVLLVKQALNISQVPKEIVEPDSTTPTDVFNVILQVNNSLNALLYKRVAPSDVFEQVTLAINYTEQLLRPFNLKVRIPTAPKFIPNKTPAQVYERLLNCIKILQEVANVSGVKMLNVSVNKNAIHQVVPSNVFDLSKIIVAESRYFNSLLPLKFNVIQAYYPGYKTPAQVYQRAGILLKQLLMLKKEVRNHSGWLKKSVSHEVGVAE